MDKKIEKYRDWIADNFEYIEGPNASAYNLINYDDKELDTDLSEQVYAELASHVEEGYKEDGMYDFYYYGATRNLEKVISIITHAYDKLQKYYADESMKITIHESCAFQSDENIKGLTVSLFFPGNRNRGYHRASVLYEHSLTAQKEQAVLIQTTLDESFKRKGFIPPEIEIILEA